MRDIAIALLLACVLADLVILGSACSTIDQHRAGGVACAAARIACAICDRKEHRAPGHDGALQP